MKNYISIIFHSIKLILWKFFYCILIFVSRLLRDKKIGEGKTRRVYSIKFTHKVVLKIAKNSPDPNKNEWNIYKHLKGTHLENKFGRCYAISCDGKYLLMESLSDVSPQDLVNNRVQMPIWVTDRKVSAYGSDGINIKLRDYGITKQCKDYINSPMMDFPSNNDIESMEKIMSILN
ncbi:hypothetical protein [Novacetimonas pomaceti]|uniref:hypothetical protein n=1 Tax=Novacetimonas pomaceti TaxID=2021998 RepID=UPI001057ACE8|nr:hypothetical protein [Novacetimonas pomaceti]